MVLWQAQPHRGLPLVVTCHHRLGAHPELKQALKRGQRAAEPEPRHVDADNVKAVSTACDASPRVRLVAGVAALPARQPAERVQHGSLPG